MTKAKQYFKEACERCEEFAAESECEVKENCPVYKLYCLMSRLKTKIDDWSTAQGNCDFNPGLQPDII